MSLDFTDDTPCERLPIPSRAKTALMFAEINTLGDLRRSFGRHLLTTPNFGHTSYRAIEAFLSRHQPITGDTTFWKARGESRRFSFEAYGPTEAAAIAALEAGFAVHARQYQLEPNWHEGAVDVSTQSITFGDVYRDSEKLPQV